MAEQKVKLTDLPAATDTIDTAQLLINQNNTDQKLPVTHFLRAKNNLSDLADIGQARANLDVPSVDEVNDKLTGFIDGSNTFLAGASLASRTDFIWDEESKSWYYWSGDLPKEVPAASNPGSTGGVSPGAWIGVGDTHLISALSASDGEKLIGECPDIATLRTIEPSYDKQRITVREHTANTGYGGGKFRAVLNGIGYTDNNGTIIKTSGGSAWIRTNSEVINPLMFGAVPRIDDTTPSYHSNINAAIAAASGKSFDGLCMDFNISGEILYNNALATKGRNLYLNAIKAAAIANIVRVNGAAHSINGFRIKGNSTDAAAGIVQSNTAAGTVIENCIIVDVGRNGIITAGKECIVRYNKTDNCGYAGSGNFRCSIQMNEGEHCVMEGNTCLHANWGILMRNEIGVTQGFYNTIRNNIVVASSSAASDSQGISASAQFHLTTSGNIVRNFVDNGIDHQNCFGLLITNNQIAGCKDAVFIGDRSCGRIVISHNNIEGCQQGVRYYNPSSNPFTGQTFSDVVISNNSILGSLNYGIWVIMAGTSSANYNTNIVNNIVDGNGSGGLGIVLENVQQGTCSDNSVRRVNGHGISLASCESIKLIGNTITDAGFGTTGTYNGINISSSNRCQAIGNSATGATMLYAIVIGAGSFNMAHMNEARSTSGATAVSISGGTGNVESLNIKS